MSRRFGILALAGALFLVTGEARAQAPAGMQETVRPATPSVYGDTGLWFVPTGEVLRDGTWSASAYRLNWDVRQGFTDISHFEGTFAYGVKGRAEIFGAIRFITRIDRDTRPIFGFGGEDYGGVDNSYPFVRQGWSGNDFGDTFFGAKYRLMSESRQNPVALALRGMLKVPTGSSDSGSGTGKMDWQIDFIVSKEVASTAEVSGSIGYRQRSDPDEYDLSSGIPFGVGAQFPTAARSSSRLSGTARSSTTTSSRGRLARTGIDYRRRWQRAPRDVQPSASVDADVRRDLAEEQRILRGWRHQLVGQG